MKKRGRIVALSLTAVLAAGLASTTLFDLAAKPDPVSAAANEGSAGLGSETVTIEESMEKVMASNSAMVGTIDIAAPQTAADSVSAGTSQEQAAGQGEALSAAAAVETVQPDSIGGWFSQAWQALPFVSQERDAIDNTQEPGQTGNVSAVIPGESAVQETSKPSETPDPLAAALGRTRQIPGQTPAAGAAGTAKPQQTPAAGAAGTAKPQQTPAADAAGTAKPQQTPAVSSASAAKSACSGSNHVYTGDWKVTKQPTCAQYGSKSRYCQCGKTAQSALYGSPTGQHQYVHKETAASCEKAGTTYDVCTTCGAKTNETAIPAAGHRYVAHETPADCAHTGVRYEECTVCKKRINTVTLPKTGHHWDKTVVIEPTCTASGYRYQECVDCGAQSSGEKLICLGHEYAVTGNVDATCTEAGYQIKSCIRCGVQEQTVTQPAMGHDMGHAQYVVWATCQQEGRTEYHCNRCGFVRAYTEPRTDHHWILNENRIGLKECRDCGLQFSENLYPEHFGGE